MNELTYIETTEFKKDFKKLKKRYKTLDDDFKLLKIATIELLHRITPIDNNSIEKITDNENFCICKIRKIACRSLKGKGAKSGLRIIYAFCKNKNEVSFLEFYFKGDKSNEDKIRIETFVKLYNDE